MRRDLQLVVWTVGWGRRWCEGGCRITRFIYWDYDELAKVSNVSVYQLSTHTTYTGKQDSRECDMTCSWWCGPLGGREGGGWVQNHPVGSLVL